jgi:hypothetical protein
LPNQPGGRPAFGPRAGTFGPPPMAPAAPDRP